MARINISGLEQGGELPFSLEVPAKGLDLGADADRFGSMVCVQGCVIRTGCANRVKGVIRCKRSFICDRCLTAAEEELEIPFSEDVSTDGSTDEEMVRLEGDMLELSGLLRDMLLMAQPIQDLCRPDCRGLCPSCGANLNLGDCDCRQSVVDPRLAVLQRWKQSGENE